MQFELVLAVAWGIRTCLSTAADLKLTQLWQVSTMVGPRAAQINTATQECVGMVLANVSVANVGPPASRLVVVLPALVGAIKLSPLGRV
jgi:uncharacterized membrane protein